MPLPHFDQFNLLHKVQFEDWLDASYDLLDLADRCGAPFPAAHATWSFGGLTLARASMSAEIVRDWSHWTSPQIDGWMLVLALHSPDSPSHSLVPRLTFRSLARPLEWPCPGGDVISLVLPRDQFVRQAKAFDSIEPSPPFSGRTALLGDYLLALEARMPLLSAAEMEAAAEATRAIVIACLTPTEERLERARGNTNQELAERAHQSIRQNLHVPGYGPESLARDLRISRSVLYRAFQPTGGVAATILAVRLDAALLRLAALNRGERIGKIARDLGFSDPSGFSRAFKKRFGYSPIRALGLDTSH